MSLKLSGLSLMRFEVPRWCDAGSPPMIRLQFEADLDGLPVSLTTTVPATKVLGIDLGAFRESITICVTENCARYAMRWAHLERARNDVIRKSILMKCRRLPSGRAVTAGGDWL